MVISHKSAQNHTKSPYPAPHKACRFYQAARTPPRIDHYPTDYIRTARAKGLTRMRVIIVHALRNAMLPVVTVIGLQVGTLLAGAILTETIFSWPGLGRWLIDALQRRDYPVVQGGVLLVATMIILVNLLVDLLYGVVNPRIRHKK
ncbi:ABC transporter permease subunit [Escherichia coli]|nr:ABC transporter permease subunit [Escherichia coli]